MTNALSQGEDDDVHKLNRLFHFKLSMLIALKTRMKEFVETRIGRIFQLHGKDSGGKRFTILVVVGSDSTQYSLQNNNFITLICFMDKASPTSSMLLWHRRLSHLNFDYITFLSKERDPRMKTPESSQRPLLIMINEDLHTQVNSVRTDRGKTEPVLLVEVLLNDAFSSMLPLSFWLKQCTQVFSNLSDGRGKSAFLNGPLKEEVYVASARSPRRECLIIAECLYTRKSTSGGTTVPYCGKVKWMRDTTSRLWLQLQQKYHLTATLSQPISNISNQYNTRDKALPTRYHFYKEQVENGIIELYFVRTEYQLADMFTKALPEDRFKYLVRRIGMRCLTPADLEVLTNETA
ncbi:hypothetical protein Tco_0357576 [Tanacetum coccineum]